MNWSVMYNISFIGLTGEGGTLSRVDQSESLKNSCASMQDNIHEMLSCLDALQLEFERTGD